MVVAMNYSATISVKNMPRPKLEKSKVKRLGLRLYEDDYLEISKYAESKNMTITEFITELARREIVLNP